MRTDAITRHDALTVIRIDAFPTDADLVGARMRVMHSGVPELEREKVVQQIAYRAAWERARDGYIGEATQRRLDGLDERSRAPTDADRALARRELANRVPADRTDAFSALAHESAIEVRARELAGNRLAAEHHAAVRATLPQPPSMPRLPQQQQLPNARTAGEPLA